MTELPYPSLASQLVASFPDNTLGSITPAITRAMLQNMLDSYPNYWIGTSAPAGSPQTFQFWVNTVANPSVLNMYDGNQWLPLASIDQTGHIIQIVFNALPTASSANFISNVANQLLVTNNYWTALAPVTLTDAATINVDMSTFINATVVLGAAGGASRTLGAPVNPKIGQQGTIEVFQDASGSRALLYASSYVFTSGAAPVLTTTASARDVLEYYVMSDNKVMITPMLNVH